MTRAATLALITLLLLPACETMEGLKRDTSKLWTNVQSGFNTMTAPEDGSAQTPLRAEDGSLMPAIASDCPSTQIMPELKTLTEFSDPSKPGDKNTISEFTLVGVQSSCKQHAAALAMQIDLVFTGKIGPKGRAAKTDQANFSYPYFIAVTDESGAVIAKEIFAANVTYAANETESKQIESITQNLPVKTAEEMRKYKVLIGFQLDDTQLAYNRQQKP